MALGILNGLPLLSFYEFIILRKVKGIFANAISLWEDFIGRKL